MNSNYGNLGIGTAVAGKKLHVFGSNSHPVILERGDNANTQIELKTAAATRGYWGASDTANFMVYDNDASDVNFTVLQTGQIGIGNIVPDTWSTGHGLTIGTSQATLWGVGDQVNLSGNAYFNSGWKAAATKAGASQIQQALGNIDFRVTGSINADAAITWTEAVRITPAGVIGINDTNPGTGKKVKVVVDNNSSYQMAVNLTNNVNADINFYIKTNESLIAPSTNTPLCLGMGGAEKLRITSNGRVGINTTTDSMDGVTGNLNIANTNYNNHTVINLSRNTAADRPQIRFQNTNGNIGSIDTSGSDLIISSGNALKFRTNSNERIEINSTGTTTFKGDSTGTEQVKIQSSGGGTGLFFGNFQGIDAGDASSRLGVGKNDNALIFTNASGSQISNFAIGNTDSIPLVLSTHNKRRFEITGSGIAIFHDNQGTYTNTVQSHAGEGAFITHYTARTTQGADLYRRMLDIASGGANPHGSSIRFLTSDDNTNPATCVERMRILNNGGVYIGNKTHNLNYPHGESPALLTVQNGARVTTTSGVYAAPKGGFCDQSRYELEQKLINISSSTVGLVQARNGQALTINEGRTSWSYYANLPNYLLGHAATDNINNISFTLTLYADMTVFLLRSNGWNSIGNTYNFDQDWHLIEQDTNISPAGSSTRLYVTTVPRGSYSWDNNSAMYIFVL